MLSEEEKRELLEMADSAAIRDEFRALRAAAEWPRAATDLDQLIVFLTTMSRFGSAHPRTFVHYDRVLL